MKLNADIGESYGKWKLGDDANIMPLIDEANIACGFHAGDPLTIQNTITLAKQHKVTIGAHVSYPDIQGFGRRSMVLEQAELIAIIHAQLALLEGMARTQEMEVKYVKPHGALYNDMMKDVKIYESILIALSLYHQKHELVIQSLPSLKTYEVLADKYDIALKLEGFADRAYTNEGLLVSRANNNAILSEHESLLQVKAMLKGDAFVSEQNSKLSLSIDTLCVHSDTPNSLELCRKYRQLIDSYASVKVSAS